MLVTEKKRIRTKMTLTIFKNNNILELLCQVIRNTQNDYISLSTL